MGEHQDDILFLKVSFDGNKDVCKTMGIKVGRYTDMPAAFCTYQ